MLTAQPSNIGEVPDDQKIMSYDEWKPQAGSKDTYGHYAEYVVCKFVNNINGRAEAATDAEDSPGGGDIWLYRSDGTRFIIDIKTTKQREISYQITGPGTADFHIPGLFVEKIRSQDRDTQIKVLESLHEVSEKLKTDTE